jgi:outer membrane protein assembly factor BamB
MAFSPEGNTIYAAGGDGCLFALDASNGAVLWEKNIQVPLISSPAVDSQGHVYCAGADKSGEKSIFSFYRDGSLRWKYSLVFGRTEPGPYHPSGITIDKNGFVYITWRPIGVTCLDYIGQLRWRALQMSTSVPILSDGDDRIYITLYSLSAIISYNSNGEKLFRINEFQQFPGGQGVAGAITFNNSILISISNPYILKVE